MDVNEVTVGQFKQFVEESGYAYEGNWNEVAKYSPTDKHPMIWVTWIMGQPMPSGQESDYPPKRNGSTLPEED